MKYVLYLYNSHEFDRQKGQYGYWKGKIYSVGQIEYPDCQKNITASTMKFNNIIKAQNKGYDCLKLKFVTGFDIESEDGEILEEQHFNKFEKEFWCLYQELNFFEKRKYLKQLKQMKGDI